MPDDPSRDHGPEPRQGDCATRVGVHQTPIRPINPFSTKDAAVAGSEQDSVASGPDSDSSALASGGLFQDSKGDCSLLRDLIAEPPPVDDSIPGYEMVREIHRGGQGVVYQAIQKATKRKVAIKVMREGPFAGRRDMARFEREIEVLGQLNHARIVNIHDSGIASGSHYFVMDYIAGQSLDDWMAARTRTIRDALRLFAMICEAVNAAHLRGIIHRDLKPGNIIVDHGEEPHILDFGLAKVATAADASVMTVTGQFIGSLPWASPEQAEAIPEKIDVRTDVYSLGVILFQMLTGRLPYGVVGNMLETFDHIVNAQPAKPSSIRREIDDEVDTIVLKCLAKERERRYQTAGELARDIGHYLGGEAIEAKRDRPLYVLRKYLRRYRLPVAVAAGFVLTLAVALLVALILLGQVARERSLARERERIAQLAYANGSLEQGTALHLAGHGQESRAAFVRARDSLIQLGVPTLPAEVGLYRSYRDFDAPIHMLGGHSDGLMAVAWLPDGIRACSASEDGTVRLWDTRTGQEIRSFVGHVGAVNGLAVSPDGKYILSGGEDQSVRIWNVDTGKEEPPAIAQTGPVRGVAFSPDGRFILSAPAKPGGAVQLADLESRTVVQSFHTPSNDTFYGVAFAPDGRRILATTYEKDIWMWDVATGEILRQFSGHTGYVISAVFSPDGTWVLSSGFDHTVRLWNAQTGEQMKALKGHTAGVRGAVFVGPADKVLSCSMDGSLRLWSLEGGEMCCAFAGHAAGVRGLAVTSDGRRAVSAGIDRALGVWDLTQTADGPVAHEADTITSLACSSDGRVFVSGDRTGLVRLRDVATLRTLKTFSGRLGPIDNATILSDEHRLFAADSGGGWRLWDIGSGEELRRHVGDGPGDSRYLRGEGWCFTAVSPDGRFVLSSRRDRAMNLTVIDSGVIVRTLAPREHAVTCVAISADSKYALCGDEGGHLHYWLLDTGECLRSLSMGPKPGSVDCAVFSADGQHALSGGHDLIVRLWDLTTGQQVRKFLGPTLVVRGVGFGREDRTVFSVGSDQTLRMWDARNGRELGLGAQLPTYGYALAGVPPGDAVLASSGSMLSLWDIPRSLRHLEFMPRLEVARSTLRASPDDGAALATLGEWYAFRGVHDWAVEFLVKARANGAPVSSLTLARCYWQLNRTTEAAGEFRTALARSEAPADYLRLCLAAVANTQPAP